MLIRSGLTDDQINHVYGLVFDAHVPLTELHDNARDGDKAPVSKPWDADRHRDHDRCRELSHLALRSRQEVVLGKGSRRESTCTSRGAVRTGLRKMGTGTMTMMARH